MPDAPEELSNTRVLGVGYSYGVGSPRDTGLDVQRRLVLEVAMDVEGSNARFIAGGFSRAGVATNGDG